MFSSSLSTRTSMRDDLMCSVGRAVDWFVAAVHLCPNFSLCAETTKCADEVETRCARFAAASGSSQTRMHAVSGCRRPCCRGCKRQMSRLERKLPAPLPGAACQEPTDVACCNAYYWWRRTQAEARTCRRALWHAAASQPFRQRGFVLASHSVANQIMT
jgi:hypothetical protein